MTATFPIPFEIGTELWVVSPVPRKEWKPCPECAGTLTNRLTTASGEWTLDCSCCGLGYEGPQGRVSFWSWEVRPEVFVCRQVRVHGDRVSYGNSTQNFTDAAELYVAREECEKACVRKREALEKEQERQAMACLESMRRNLSWSVNYWIGQRKKLREDLERVERRLNAIRATAGGKP